MDDLAIIELYHKRDEQAIAESDRKYGGMCRSIALHLLGNREDAEECVNDTWYAAWRKMPPERPASLGAFLGRITRNLSVSRWRREHAQKRNDGLEVLLAELEECVPSAETVESTVERKMLAEVIGAWLDTLEREEQWLFIRRYWYADSVKDLASTLREQPNTCSQRLCRLRKELRIFLESKGVAQ